MKGLPVAEPDASLPKDRQTSLGFNVTARAFVGISTQFAKK
jgi:hypothetical protein